MTGQVHKDLVAIAAGWLKKTHSVVLTEMAGSGECPDAIGFTAGFSTLVECKATRSDFRADSSKGYRAYPPNGMGVFRYYMAPAGLIQVGELPPNWGLLEVSGKGKVQTAARASAQKSNKGRECALLVSTLRRVTQVNPEGVSVRFYPILTGETATIGIEPAGDPPRPSLDLVSCDCRRTEGEEDGEYFGHWNDCAVAVSMRAAQAWDKRYGRESDVLP